MKLGTRKSLLAWAQSSWVAREIEKQNPGTRVELVGIETRGDRILDVSLQAIAETTGGKEFFVAELDEALRSGAVDLTVHSMKDLSLDRPPEFACAAIPARENPRDVALFRPGILEALRRGEKVRIGTSSPRRLENAPAFLRKALPQFAGKEPPREPDVELIEMRGNVNTRLGRIHEPAGSERQLDGVILAFAGMIRLWNDEKGREELKRLLAGVRWMVLPLKECPAAPAQGALAVECRRSDSVTFGKVRKIHSTDTEAHVVMERSLLAEWGGGCHQKFGATAISTQNLSKLFFIRGKKPDGEFVDELRWPAPRRLPKNMDVRAWDGSEWRSEAGSEPIAGAPSSEPGVPGVPGVPRVQGAAAYFVAHWRAVSAETSTLLGLDQARIWTSGTASWYRLAAMGLWVEGCAENFGFETLRSTLSEGVLGLPEFREWNVLTHSGASEGWDCRVIETYRLTKNDYPEQAVRDLERATHVFWSSGSQFDELKGRVSEDARQACGPGKTSDHLRGAGVRPVIFPSVEEWKKWINEG